MKLSEIISPEKFRALADFIDCIDKKNNILNNEVQSELRKFADALEKKEAEYTTDPKEQRFLELISGIKEIEPDYWVNDKGEWLIDNRQGEKNGYTWVSYWRIWQFFENEFSMNYYEIQDFIKEMLLKHFKIESTTPHYRL